MSSAKINAYGISVEIEGAEACGVEKLTAIAVATFEGVLARRPEQARIGYGSASPMSIERREDTKWTEHGNTWSAPVRAEIDPDCQPLPRKEDWPADAPPPPGWIVAV